MVEVRNDCRGSPGRTGPKCLAFLRRGFNFLRALNPSNARPLSRAFSSQFSIMTEHSIGKASGRKRFALGSVVSAIPGPGCHLLFEQARYYSLPTPTDNCTRVGNLFYRYSSWGFFLLHERNCIEHGGLYQAFRKRRDGKRLGWHLMFPPFKRRDGLAFLILGVGKVKHGDHGACHGTNSFSSFSYLFFFLFLLELMPTRQRYPHSVFFVLHGLIVVRMFTRNFRLLGVCSGSSITALGQAQGPQ